MGANHKPHIVQQPLHHQPIRERYPTALPVQTRLSGEGNEEEMPLSFLCVNLVYGRWFTLLVQSSKNRPHTTMLDHLPVRWLLPTVLPLLRVLLLAILRGAHQGSYPAPTTLLHHYDFVIAGGEPPPESIVPGLSRVFYFPSESTWDYFLHPQRHGLRNYRNRGRVLGGSSAINGMLYVRGNRRDYDHWAALGNRGWDYDSVLPYFRKAEGYRGPLSPSTESYHGREGPLPVTPDEENDGFTSAFLKAGEQLGYSVIDPSGPEQIDRFCLLFSHYFPLSLSLCLSITPLTPNTSPSLLKLKSLKFKVIFNQEKRAVGVKYLYKGEVRKVSVKREVVMSAGALASPKLLMLSGVGHRDHLNSHGVKVVVDLPGVGQNLQDHVCLYGLTWTLPPGSPTGVLNVASPKMVSDYIHHRTGSYSTPLSDFGHAWALVNGAGHDPYWPDIQLFMASNGLAQEGILASVALGLDTKKYLQHYSSLFGRPGMTIMPYLTRPLSRGSITLASRDPLQPMIIDPNYLSHPDDVTTLVNGIKLAVQLSKTPAMASTLGAKLYAKPLQECAGKVFGSDKYWRCYVLHMATTFYHFAGTCRMGPASDPYSVVDDELKLRGVAGVRVVDASVMPVVVSGNPMAAIIMIAERAADVIKQDWTSAR
ncbi:Glucose dehydrogenase [FAD quinone]-like 15 [Homarus americanus]|uniref:Glucose dehydrogenase [FAD quinone]-like 15 n=1 Tax=Homarus americanus TaxID=6706 RepID=A0A8J5K8C1_HOMAM|nr:Glucose dehydrogenase [FAD quinone]-like 15 [Homarus americanus]